MAALSQLLNEAERLASVRWAITIHETLPSNVASSRISHLRHTSRVLEISFLLRCRDFVPEHGFRQSE